MPLRFSDRTNWDTSEGELTRTIRAAGRDLCDLTVSNPTLCGFSYDPALLSGLADPEALVYDPDPRGMKLAREAVAEYYSAHHAAVNADHILLTTSTSEAYSFLFRLLANPGDSVLVGVPGYPLFDFLAALDDVLLTTYPLFYDFGWWIDFAELQRRITPRTKALVLVHPNNPTGHATTLAERSLLEELCVRNGLALIVDEVFLDYGLTGKVQSFAVGPHPCLTLVISGISKICALPQMKLGWVAAFGPEILAGEALARLEVVADTFLSMNAPVQLAATGWLRGREAIQRQIMARIRTNFASLEGLGALPVEAGWCAVLRLPMAAGPGSLAKRLVQEAGVVTHPGSFYGMPQANRLVVSLLGASEDFAQGVGKLKQWVDSR